MLYAYNPKPCMSCRVTQNINTHIQPNWSTITCNYLKHECTIIVYCEQKIHPTNVKHELNNNKPNRFTFYTRRQYLYTTFSFLLLNSNTSSKYLLKPNRNVILLLLKHF